MGPSDSDASGNSGLLEIVAGDAQLGLTGRALADSIVVRARTPSGAPAVGVELSWSASAGTLSTTRTITDGSGLARVQWIAGSGVGTATVTYPVSTSAAGRGARARLTISSEGQASGACRLTPSEESLTLGPTDPKIHLEATAPHHAVVLFMDFSDSPATETTEFLMNRVVRPGLTRLNELSYGRVQLQVTATPRWYRLPSPRAAVEGGYVHHAMRLSDADVDFSRYDAVYLFTPPVPPDTFSYAILDGGSDFDGVRAGKNGAMFGRDARIYGAPVFVHETSHMFGLPDLYRLDPRGGSPYANIVIRDVGSWSVMSNAYVPAHHLAWEKRKLGFLDADQLDCLEGPLAPHYRLADPIGEEAVLQPIEVPGGLKAIAVRLDDSRALVMEVRSRQGLGDRLCTSGVLIYEVDASAESGAGPARIRGSRVTTSGPLFDKCGPWADATYGVGPGEISSFTDPASGTRVQVLAAEAGGAFRVRVKR